MHIYEAKKFTLPSLDGISDESVKQHIGLYEGYVKNFNGMSKALMELDAEKDVIAIAEIIRRRSFEFGGMRLHEYYFSQFEGGSVPVQNTGALARAIAKKYNSQDAFLGILKRVANIRGPGWAILYYDKTVEELHLGFSGEQHQGHYVGLPIILTLDVWEHTYILDYGAAGKGKYIDAFFKNLNWGIVEKRFEEVLA